MNILSSASRDDAATYFSHNINFMRLVLPITFAHLIAFKAVGSADYICDTRENTCKSFRGTCRRFHADTSDSGVYLTPSPVPEENEKILSALPPPFPAIALSKDASNYELGVVN